jgi:hypothetical protein
MTKTTTKKSQSVEALLDRLVAQCPHRTIRVRGRRYRVTDLAMRYREYVRLRDQVKAARAAWRACHQAAVAAGEVMP